LEVVELVGVGLGADPPNERSFGGLHTKTDTPRAATAKAGFFGIEQKVPNERSFGGFACKI